VGKNTRASFQNNSKKFLAAQEKRFGKIFLIFNPLAPDFFWYSVSEIFSRDFSKKKFPGTQDKCVKRN